MRLMGQFLFGSGLAGYEEKEFQNLREEIMAASVISPDEYAFRGHQVDSKDTL